MSDSIVPQLIVATSALPFAIPALRNEEEDVDFAALLSEDGQSIEQKLSVEVTVDPTVDANESEELSSVPGGDRLEKPVVESDSNQGDEDQAQQASLVPEQISVPISKAVDAKENLVDLPTRQKADVSNLAARDIKIDPKRTLTEQPLVLDQKHAESLKPFPTSIVSAIQTISEHQEKLLPIVQQNPGYRSAELDLVSKNTIAAAFTSSKENQPSLVKKAVSDEDTLQGVREGRQLRSSTSENIVQAKNHWTAVSEHPQQHAQTASVPDRPVQALFDTPEMESKTESVSLQVIQRSTSENSTAPTTPAAQVQMARAAAGQMAVAVTQNGPGTTEILLSPEELGTVRMVVTAQDTTISLVVQAERPETHELLRRQIETLAQEFRSLGFGSISFTFEDGQGDSAADSNEAQTDTPVIDTSETDQASKVLASMLHSNGLDLRL